MFYTPESPIKYRIINLNNKITQNYLEMSATNKQDRIQINNTFGTNVENKRDSEWKSKIENQNRSLKKLRESSLSQERNKNRFDSYNNLGMKS